jgi:hypothetical protein
MEFHVFIIAQIENEGKSTQWADLKFCTNKRIGQAPFVYSLWIRGRPFEIH